jgi:hypothetical protein
LFGRSWSSSSFFFPGVLRSWIPSSESDSQ